MARSTVHYADNTTNNILKRLHNKLRPAGTPVQRVEYIIELLLLRIFEVKLKQDPEFVPLRKMFVGENDDLLYSSLASVANENMLEKLNTRFFPFYANILTNARKVLKGNPSDKVRDQLVLIEEVFSNSNFSNNVTSGNLGEVVGLVGELEEDRLMKTDLLGDAIESALSETGGTKDIGLHRTPDHIRQFMVGLVLPSFSDSIFDPTAGTAGFLFDSYEFVMQTVRPNGKWPGEKAHKELVAWFKEYFEAHKRRMPSLEVTNDFYRQGIMGIEYLGMIRKMAAINLYIRGLNPGNILQGDSLAKFKRDYNPASKSVILTNPPFGAERDQEAYPDVWSEYPKESETTILFVKLVLETLAKKGRCAVIVSEGFMSWDQNSARALRKSLLEEANLRAIISLPPGVFVSKGGQGPKTSILYFEKASPTKDVWYYKVTNDGYSMGTNRKEIPGCQLVEALNLFHEYVREGKRPPESRHAFSIPTEWITTLDPRIKEKIRIETSDELNIKAEEDKSKLASKLTEQVTAKKITGEEKRDKLNQLGQIWDGKIRNEIARRIERAQLFSFNLPNYRSSLTDEQCAEWAKINNVVINESRSGLEIRYQQMQKASVQELPKLLSQIDPHNALELDIARQNISRIEGTTLAESKKLKKLSGILAMGKKYQRVRLSDILKLRRDILKKEDYLGEIDIVGKIRFSDGKIFLRDEKSTASNLQFTEKNDLVISKINFHQGATAVNSVGRVLASLDYLIYEVVTTEAIPSFVAHIIRLPQFLTLLEENKPGGVKGRSQPELIETLSIPLPRVDEQQTIVDEIERFQNIVDGASSILNNWTIDSLVSLDGIRLALGDLVEVDGEIVKDPTQYPNSIYVGGENIESGTGRLLNPKTIEDGGIIGPAYKFKAGQIVYSKVRPNLRKCFYSEFDGMCSSDIYPLSLKSDKVLPQYLALVLASKSFANATAQFHERAGMPKINRDQLSTIVIQIPEKTLQQKAIDQYVRNKKMLADIEEEMTISKRLLIRTLDDIWEN